MAAFSHFSVIRLGSHPAGRVIFPGSVHIDCGRETLGYVRSRLRASIVAARGGTARDLPFRDYASELLTDPTKIPLSESERPCVIVSARNVMNEYGYRARIAGRWFGRSCDAEIDPRWPVAQFRSAGRVKLVEYRKADENSDLLTGVPLVMTGRPCQRQFFVAHCSDVAHTFHVHPKGLIGPSAEAWQALSDAWEDGKASGLPDEDLALRLESLARSLGAEESRDLLHSAIGQNANGDIFLFAVTGSLRGIAKLLAERFLIEQAFLLDNGGSVGWLYIDAQAQTPARFIVSGPNFRAKGSAFLIFPTSGFLQPSEHPDALDD